MKTIPLAELVTVLSVNADGELRWLIRPARNVFAGSIAGYVNQCGYRVVHYKGRLFKASRIVFALANGRWPCHEVDHINMIRDDDRPDNLRDATTTQNGQNKGLSPKATTGYKGVAWSKKEQRFQAQIRVNTKRLWLGYFDSAQAAYESYCRAALKYHGEFARLA